MAWWGDVGKAGSFSRPTRRNIRFSHVCIDLVVSALPASKEVSEPPDMPPLARDVQKDLNGRMGTNRWFVDKIYKHDTRPLRLNHDPPSLAAGAAATLWRAFGPD
jgi:hypothetical protein